MRTMGEHRDRWIGFVCYGVQLPLLVIASANKAPQHEHARSGMRMKLELGGTTGSLFPSPPSSIRFSKLDLKRQGLKVSRRLLEGRRGSGRCRHIHHKIEVRKRVTLSEA